MLQLQQSESTSSLRRVPIACVDATDGYTPETGLSFSAGEIKLSKNGATEVNHGGSVVEVAGGMYYYEATSGELDTLGTFSVRVNKSGVRGAITAVQVVPWDPYDAAAQGMTNINATMSSRLAASAYENTDAFLDKSNALETGVTVRGAMRLILAVLGGKLSGAGTGTEVFRNAVADSKARVTASVDTSGNRTSITTDLT